MAQESKERKANWRRFIVTLWTWIIGFVVVILTILLAAPLPAKSGK